MKSDQMSTREQLRWVGIGMSIAVFYTGLFMIVVNLDDDGYLEIKSLIPEASAQILPFEQQLEQIREPKECTRKVIQGKSAEVPFTMKVFYDTTRDNKLEFKQQGTSFPIVQRTNQVMTFFTEGTDQYEIYMELNYEEAQPRQIYIEFLSENRITQSTQEKFEGLRFCMTIFVNTVKPVAIPTKEEIFGESLDYIRQIPAMVTAFNANSQTSATNISYQWILILAMFVMSILTIISSYNAKGAFDSKKKDLEDSIKSVNTLATNMDELERKMIKPFKEMVTNLRLILSLPQIQEKLPKEEKKSLIKSFIKITHKKKKDDHPKDEVKTESQEVIEELQEKPEDVKEETQQTNTEPTGGYVLSEEQKDSTQTQSPPSENNPMRLKPNIIDKIIKEIDFESKSLKEGAMDKFSYTELNESFSWISNYIKWIEDEELDVPDETKAKQVIAREVIYYAVFVKMDQRSKI